MANPKKEITVSQSPRSVPDMLASLAPMTASKEDFPVILAIVEEMARADGWDNLDECFAEGISIVDNYMTFADAALRVMRRFNIQPVRH